MHNVENKVGFSTEPCGVPVEVVILSDSLPLTIVYCAPAVRKFTTFLSCRCCRLYVAINCFES